jgi:hypothetical protein
MGKYKPRGGGQISSRALRRYFGSTSETGPLHADDGGVGDMGAIDCNHIELAEYNRPRRGPGLQIRRRTMAPRVSPVETISIAPATGSCGCPAWATRNSRIDRYAPLRHGRAGPRPVNIGIRRGTASRRAGKEGD